MHPLTRLAFPLILCVCAAAPLRAADGRIPIAAPLTISAPGYYYLTKDLAPAAGPAVTISADNVVLDLNGHLITAVTGSYGVYAANHTEITVLNGRIAGGSYGVALNVLTAMPAPPHFRVQGIEVIGAAASGISLYSSSAANHFRAELIGNRTARTAGDGIAVQYMDYGLIQDNISEESTTGTSGGGSCISLLVISNSVVTGNLASKCQTDGLTIFQGLNNRIENNHAASAGGTGLRVYNAASGNSILNNSASACAGGISVVGNGNLIDGNTATTSTGQAISLSGNNNAYAGNHTMNNGTNGVTASGTGNVNGGGNY